MKHKIVQLSLIISFLTIVLLTACKKDNSNSNGNNNNGGGGGGGTQSKNEVSIMNFSFSPSQLTTSKDSTVTWTNNDSAPHTVTADDGSFTSGTLNQGDVYSHTFTSIGTVKYHCNIHKSMTASIVVQ